MLSRVYTELAEVKYDSRHQYPKYPLQCKKEGGGPREHALKGRNNIAQGLAPVYIRYGYKKKRPVGAE